MPPTRQLIFALLIGFFFIANGFAHGTGDHAHPEHDEGIETAEHWLNLVDEQKYNASWQTAAPALKSAITAGEWEKTITSVRTPLGDLIERNLYHNRIDGEYLILRFVTTFKNKQSAVESVTVMKDDNDTWRVAGYFIK